jgi:hypothetical protein
MLFAHCGSARRRWPSALRAETKPVSLREGLTVQFLLYAVTEAGGIFLSFDAESGRRQ